ncbi:MAG: histidine phosphatase family protein [Pseudomonadota bacterium]
MTKVILIRHGQTSWNLSRRVQGGNNDTVLDEEGERQCRHLAQRLKKEDIKAVYSSPLSRAMGTAQWIADDHNLDVIEEPAFREMDCGALEGAEIGDIGSRLQKLINGGNEDELLFKGCGGESCDQLQNRAWNAILEKVEKHRDGTIVVVSHYFLLASILCAAVGIPATQLGRFRIGATSICSVSFDSYGPFLSLFNDRCHLTPA